MDRLRTGYSLGDGHGDVVNGQSPFFKQVLSHVGERGRGIDGVPADPVPFQVRRGVSCLKNPRLSVFIFFKVLFLGSLEAKRLIYDDRDVYNLIDDPYKYHD